MTDNFELYLKLVEHAKIQQDTAREEESERDTYYWQGVKDGLRRMYTALLNDTGPLRAGGLSQDRPDGARESWRNLWDGETKC